MPTDYVKLGKQTEARPALRREKLLDALLDEVMKKRYMPNDSKGSGGGTPAGYAGRRPGTKAAAKRALGRAKLLAALDAVIDDMIERRYRRRFHATKSKAKPQVAMTPAMKEAEIIKRRLKRAAENDRLKRRLAPRSGAGTRYPSGNSKHDMYRRGRRLPGSAYSRRG
jgi:hypothetical protein